MQIKNLLIFTGEGIYAFLSLKENVSESKEDIIKELKALVKSKIAAYAIPEYFLVSQL